MNPTRRALFTLPLLALGAAPAEAADFATYLGVLRRAALARGLAPGLVDAALRGLSPDPQVLALTHAQPEFTQSWQQYASGRLTAGMIAAGRAARARNAALLARITARYGVPGPILVAIWGMESSYGAFQGNFSTLRSLATLGWRGPRAAFFRGEFLDALRILAAGDISAPAMVGSWAGAMGQPQFMPSTFLRYAVDFSGTGRRDIWNDTGDCLASMANYLAAKGWRRGGGWGGPAAVPPGFDPALAGWRNRRPLGRWLALGVRPLAAPVPAPRSIAAVLLPGGAGGPAYLAYANFLAIRAYNHSDSYALSVGLLAGLVAPAG